MHDKSGKDCLSKNIFPNPEKIFKNPFTDLHFWCKIRSSIICEVLKLWN